MSKLLTVISGHGFIMTSRPLAWAVGLKASVLLGELCSRQAQHGADFWATNEQLSNSTTLSEREIRGASRRLVEAGFINVGKNGLPARNQYTVNVDALVEFFSEDVESCDLDNGGDDYSRDDKSLRNDSDQSLQNAATIGHETQAHIKNESNNETIRTNKHIVRKPASALYVFGFPLSYSSVLLWYCFHRFRKCHFRFCFPPFWISWKWSHLQMWNLLRCILNPASRKAPLPSS